MKWMVMMLITLAREAEGVARPAVNLFPSVGATLIWAQVLFFLVPTVLVIGGIWYLWRLLRALERIADGLNKER